MTPLKAFINSHPVAERAAIRRQLAEAAGVSVSSVKHYANGIRKCPPATALKFEEATNGKVSAHNIVFGDSTAAE